MARFWGRHLKGAVRVRPSAQSANTVYLSVKVLGAPLGGMYILSQQHNTRAPLSDTALAPALPALMIMAMDSVRAWADEGSPLLLRLLWVEGVPLLPCVKDREIGMMEEEVDGFCGVRSMRR